MRENKGEQAPQSGGDTGREVIEPVATGYGRNVWILIVMLGVVLLAWLIALAGGGTR